MENTEVAITDITGVAVSEGPGSYTGLRIGGSAAKAFAYAWEVPLLPVSTLDILIRQAYSRSLRENTLIVPLIDARRMEVYMKITDLSFRELWSTQALIVEEGTFADLEDHHLLLVGNGSEKVYDAIGHPSKAYLNVLPEAGFMGKLAYEALLSEKSVDPAYFEPFYLKEFQTKKSKDLLRP